MSICNRLFKQLKLDKKFIFLIRRGYGLHNVAVICAVCNGTGSDFDKKKEVNSALTIDMHNRFVIFYYSWLA